MPRAAGSAPKKPAVKKGRAKGHVLPETLPEGEVLTDIRKKSWRLGPPVGTGGFGAVYAASEAGTDSGASYVIKIEPHGNGPLFVEMHFYMKISKPEEIHQWLKDKKIKHLGIPQFHGHGSHEYNGKKYRFIVIDRFGRNVHSIFQKNKKLSLVTAFQLGVQIVNILEFIHVQGYCHADIKGDNLLLGCEKGSENQVFLVDFGLAEQCTKAKEKPDPKKAHNGTAEYTSRDAHRGVVGKRGDLEILAYNMLHWMSGKLPWEKQISDCVKLAALKEEYMSDVPKLMKECFGSSKPPDALVKFFNYIAVMDHSGIDYNKCRSICIEGLKKLKSGVDKPLDIDADMGTPSIATSAGGAVKGRKRRSNTSGGRTVGEPSRKRGVKETVGKGVAVRKPAASQKTETTDSLELNHESGYDGNLSNGYVDVPDSPVAPSRQVNAKRGVRNKRKSIVSSVLVGSSLGRRKSVGFKKRLSVVAKKILPSSAAKAASWRDCPTIASSSKYTAKLTNSKSQDAPTKGRGRGRKAK